MNRIASATVPLIAVVSVLLFVGCEVDGSHPARLELEAALGSPYLYIEISDSSVYTYYFSGDTVALEFDDEEASRFVSVKLAGWNTELTLTSIRIEGGDGVVGLDGLLVTEITSGPTLVTEDTAIGSSDTSVGIQVHVDISFTGTTTAEIVIETSNPPVPEFRAGLVVTRE